MPRSVGRGENRTKEILLTLAKVGIFAIGATSPYFLHEIIKAYFGDENSPLARARARRLRELQKRKFVDFEELSTGEVRITLTHLGKEIVRQYKLEEMRLRKPKKWDGYWRIIMYDIPTSRRKASGALRRKLDQLGLYKLQKSVWVSPYECMPELEFLCGVFEIDISANILYFKTKELQNENAVKKFFDL